LNAINEEDSFLKDDVEGSDSSMQNATLEQQEEDATAAVARQYVLRAVVYIYAVSIDNVRGEEDL
jgi:hypothetical protein